MKRNFVVMLLLALPIGLLAQSSDPNIELSLNEPAFGVNIKTNFPGGNGIWARGYRVSNQNGSENFIQLGSYGYTTNGVTKQTYSFIGLGYDQTFLSFLPTGNVGIGTISPKEKLSVNGKIRAHEIKVETTNWPDYVFTDGYQLPTLKETAEFIDKNKHLPGVPKAAEIEENGLSLGEMNKILMQKVEELTLHLIEKDKKIENQDKRLEKLEEIVEKLTNRK